MLVEWQVRAASGIPWEKLYKFTCLKHPVLVRRGNLVQLGNMEDLQIINIHFQKF